MIQDIAPHKLENHYDPSAKPEKGDAVLALRGGKICCRTDGENVYPSVSDMPAGTPLRFLFSVDGRKYFLYEGKEELPEENGLCFRELRELREAELLPKYEFFAAYTAKHLSDWYRDTKFCGRCGAETKHSETERAKVCPVCGYTAYPRIMPAVIVGVTNGDRLLLTRYRTGYGHNALVAGFTEIGETLEETVSREVMEEAGIRVKNIRYYKSQPWGVANDILVGYYCDVDGDDHIQMDPGELKYAEWVAREDIVLQPDDISLTNEMMKRFKEGGN